MTRKHPSRPPACAASTEELCGRWVASYAALEACLDPRLHLELTGLRRACLDELERRDPVGFARWLADGPLPGSDPAGYVQGDPAAGTDAA